MDATTKVTDMARKIFLFWMILIILLLDYFLSVHQPRGLGQPWSGHQIQEIPGHEDGREHRDQDADA
jgi:hypothetical protein